MSVAAMKDWLASARCQFREGCREAASSQLIAQFADGSSSSTRTCLGHRDVAISDAKEFGAVRISEIDYAEAETVH